MFIDVVQGGERVELLALLALAGAFLLGGFAFGGRGASRERRMPTWTRMAFSLTLVAGGWSWYLFTRDGPAGGYAIFVALGMTLGCLGDLALAGVLRLREPLPVGMGAFGLGHVCYIVALLRFGNLNGLAAAGPRFGALAGWLLIGVLGWYVVVARGVRLTPLRWAALAYTLLLSGTAGVALGLALQAGAFLPAALGGALFLISDLVLAGQLFGELSFPLIGDVIWLTYGGAQALLVYGANAAMLTLLTRS